MGRQGAITNSGILFSSQEHAATKLKKKTTLQMICACCAHIKEGEVSLHNIPSLYNHDRKRFQPHQQTTGRQRCRQKARGGGERQKEEK